MLFLAAGAAFLWSRFAISVGVAYAAALAFYPFIRRGRRSRTVAWLIASVVVASCPCLVPLPAGVQRFLAAMASTWLLVKLYDLYREPEIEPAARDISLGSYLAYLVNGFWLVWRRKPASRRARGDLGRLAVLAPA